MAGPVTSSRLTLGTAQLGDAYGIANRVGRLSDRQVHALLTSALDLGLRSFDTAPAYGVAETRLGAFFQKDGWPSDAVVISKLPALGPIEARDVPDTVAAALHGSLRRLRRARLDHYLVHRADDLARHGDVLVGALVRHIEAGEVGRAGVSVYGPHEVELMMRWPELGSIQFPLNLLDRRMVESGALSRLIARGATTFARSAFLQGLLALSEADLPTSMRHASAALRRLRTVLARHGVAPAEAALAFVHSFPVDSVVIGVETPEQLRANVAALDVPIPPGLASELAVALGALDESILNPARWPALDPASRGGAVDATARAG